jgi:hypothetical protein
VEDDVAGIMRLALFSGAKKDAAPAKPAAAKAAAPAKAAAKVAPALDDATFRVAEAQVWIDG